MRQGPPLQCSTDGTAGRHKAIIAYLSVINAPKTAAAFREEVSIAPSFDDATRKKYEGLLEKKWTSVVRLQKKVLFMPRLVSPMILANRRRY